MQSIISFISIWLAAFFFWYSGYRMGQKVGWQKCYDKTIRFNEITIAAGRTPIAVPDRDDS